MKEIRMKTNERKEKMKMKSLKKKKTSKESVDIFF